MSRDPYRAQAEKLRQKIEKVEPVPEQKETEQKRTLPKRSELHQEKKKTVKYPLIKGMAAFFILLPLIMFGIYSVLDINPNENRSIVTEKGQREEVTYETRDIEEEVKSGSNSDKNTEAAVREPEPESPPQPAEEPQTAVQKKAPAEEVDEEDLVQLAEQEEAAEETGYQENVQIIEHVVKPQETLFRIAMNYYKSQAGMDKIKEWNNIENNDLQAGQVLEIPLPVD
ncbi:LysM peptidoglycan-binding domain-containing protein [Bacillus salacetis]|uniref:LysM peptidoglycan-binding domain-containing protein n=1 Tax=Bacillus salacetis TaxID=2315464 RepID=A0A3A1QP32_9BACI|nr:LysM peptidoglycan-binding domain-containing protein [Bacillus salacetis]RIW28001.1 LysM peptidoglycan-binding domain-containing protein [Bacillus salacetis]